MWGQKRLALPSAARRPRRWLEQHSCPSPLGRLGPPHLDATGILRILQSWMLLAPRPDIRPLPRRAPQLDPSPGSTQDALGTLTPSSGPLELICSGSPVPFRCASLPWPLACDLSYFPCCAPPGPPTALAPAPRKTCAEPSPRTIILFESRFLLFFPDFLRYMWQPGKNKTKQKNTFTSFYLSMKPQNKYAFLCSGHSSTDMTRNYSIHKV